jgi:hypothetical protein
VTSTWIVYGLLANRQDDHDLRFIGTSEHPQQLADAHPEFEACMAFPQETADQVVPGTKLVDGVAAVVQVGLFGARWPNAAERA